MLYAQNVKKDFSTGDWLKLVRQKIIDIKLPSDGLNSDIHASAKYRAHLVNVMARRAIS